MKHLSRFCVLALILAVLPCCQSINRSRSALSIDRPKVILSFDDGPNAHGDTTARLLDVLKKYRVQAMFALLGENAEHNPELVRRIRDEGHSVINHGYYDRWASQMTDGEFRENLLRGEAAISAALGEELQPKLYRPQGGYYTAKQKKILRKADYTLINGSIRIYDAVMDAGKKRKAVKQLVKMVEEQGGGLILLHDARDSHFRMEAELAKNPAGPFNRSWIPEAVEEIILALLEKGYRFELAAWEPDGRMSPGSAQAGIPRY
jgi:peptidoglycan/xylan/chitin deacetylase (PgdA/CDA1 family)